MRSRQLCRSCTQLREATSQATPQRIVNYEDYLVGDETSEEKREWLAGVVCAMSRGTPEHGRLTANVTAALRVALKGICSIYSADTVFRRPDGVGHWSHEVSTAGQTFVVHGQSIGRILGVEREPGST